VGGRGWGGGGGGGGCGGGVWGGWVVGGGGEGVVGRWLGGGGGGGGGGGLSPGTEFTDQRGGGGAARPCAEIRVDAAVSASCRHERVSRGRSLNRGTWAPRTDVHERPPVKREAAERSDSISIGETEYRYGRVDEPRTSRRRPHRSRRQVRETRQLPRAFAGVRDWRRHGRRAEPALSGGGAKGRWKACARGPSTAATSTRWQQ